MHQFRQANRGEHGLLVSGDSDDLLEELRYVIASAFGSDGDTRIEN
jgi:hypothetical protein